MYCTKCGKQLNDDALICVNCGVATRNFNLIPEVRNEVGDKKLNGLGIAGFVIGLSSLFVLPMIFCFAVILGVGYGYTILITSTLCLLISAAGIAISSVGMARAKNYRPSGLATAGLILSIIACLFWVYFCFMGFMIVLP